MKRYLERFVDAMGRWWAMATSSKRQSMALYFSWMVMLLTIAAIAGVSEAWLQEALKSLVYVLGATVVGVSVTDSIQAKNGQKGDSKPPAE